VWVGFSCFVFLNFSGLEEDNKIFKQREEGKLSCTTK